LEPSKENVAVMEGFRIIQKEAYVRFDYTGEFSEAAGKQCVDAMVEACSQLQFSKALLDCRKMTGEIQILESFMVAQYGGKMRGFLSKTALVGREDQMLPDNFVENVAVNRGVNLKIFTDIEEAIDWLKE
jgi:hypothetical protein